MSANRRPKIRAPKKNISLTANFETSWSRLALAIREIHKKNASQFSFEELYRLTYSLVLNKHAKQVYEGTKQEIWSCLASDVAAELGPMVAAQADSASSSPSKVLKSMCDKWNDHCLCMRLVGDIMMYLDRIYAKEARLPLTYDAGLTTFRDAVIRHGSPTIGSRIYDIVVAEVQKEREGQTIDRLTIKQVALMLEALPESRPESESIYVAEFEPRLERATEEFYESAATKLLEENNDAGVYIRKVDEWLQGEADRCRAYLSEMSTLPKLIAILDRVLIIERLKEVAQNSQIGYKEWIDNSSFDELRLMYRLSARVMPDHTDLRDLLQIKIISSGEEINRSTMQALSALQGSKGPSGGAPKQPRDRSLTSSTTGVAVKWVEDVLALKDHYDTMLRACFGSDRNIETTIEDAFSKFVNDFARSAEFLSLFIDDNLKKSLKGKSEEEAEQVLLKAITLFRFIADKDKFETYYKVHLAKRLLNNKSVSDDVERNMIGKIKMEVGTAFTSKLEGMFRDMKLSHDMMADFKRARADGLFEVPIDTSVNILTSSFWPPGIVSSKTPCVYPREISDAKQGFEKFYLSKHSGRVLTWNPNLGSVDIKVRFAKKTHEINMPIYAASIVMLFRDLDESQSLSYEEIRDATGIPETDLARHLLSIAVAPKTRVLRKNPMNKTVVPGDRFSFNSKFESPMTRIKVLTVSAGNKVESEAERKETMEQVDQSRKFEVDAAIVRMMKARKRMNHANLVAEVTKQLMNRFHPQPNFIKQRIEALLEREYLERDATERSTYNYLA
ncbi:cullin-3 [Trichomonascus vanleenenianus]|uniref:cullin family protein n=1 Tax=Trichomonascus vanleenenianus TaxID=2268995 RepID=UPI003EC9B1E7